MWPPESCDILLPGCIKMSDFGTRWGKMSFSICESCNLLDPAANSHSNRNPLTKARMEKCQVLGHIMPPQLSLCNLQLSAATSAAKTAAHFFLWLSTASSHCIVHEMSPLLPVKFQKCSLEGQTMPHRHHYGCGKVHNISLLMVTAVWMAIVGRGLKTAWWFAHNGPHWVSGLGGDVAWGQNTG